MRIRKWLYAISAVFTVTLVMFPLNLLWVGQPPLRAFVSSLLFGLPALLSAWTPKERRTDRRTESAVRTESAGYSKSAGRDESPVRAESSVRADSVVHSAPARRKSLLSKVALSKVALGIAVLVLATMLVYDIATEGVAVGVTKAIGFGLLILVAALGYRLGYLKL